MLAAGQSISVSRLFVRRYILECRVYENSRILIHWGRGDMSEYSVLLYDFVTLGSFHPTLYPSGSQGLSLWALPLRCTVSVFLLCWLLANKQRMDIVLKAITPCPCDVAPFDRCNIYRIVFFSAILATTFLVIGHNIGLVVPKKLEYVSSLVSSLTQSAGIVGDRQERPPRSLTLCK